MTTYLSLLTPLSLSVSTAGAPSSISLRISINSNEIDLYQPTHLRRKNL